MFYSFTDINQLIVVIYWLVIFPVCMTLSLDSEDLRVVFKGLLFFCLFTILWCTPSAARHQPSRFWSYQTEWRASCYNCSNFVWVYSDQLSAYSNARCWSLQSGPLVLQVWDLIDDWVVALNFARKTCTHSLLLLQ